jgi:DNA-binding ferritin-like protein (Dps family)
VANFSWWEEAENENMLIDVESDLGNLLVRFGDFTLGAGQSAILDPTVTLTPNNDSYVREYFPDEINGSSQDLYIYDVGSPADRIWTYMGFDLSSIPPGASVTSAKLDLYCHYFKAGSSEAVSDAVDLYETSSFDESTLTWNNRPGFAGFLDNVVSFDEDTWYEWQSDALENYVESKAGASAWFGLRGNKDGQGYVSPPEGMDYSSAWSFYSKDYTSNHPYLEVTYTARIPSDDAYVSEWSPGGNYGSDQDLHIIDIGSPAQRYWTYVGFDLSSIPPGASVTSAKLSLYCHYFKAGSTSACSDAVELYETSSFDESTLTWNNRPGFADFLDNVISFDEDTWYEWQSDALKNYVESKAGSSAWFGLCGNKDGDGYVNAPEQIDYSSTWTFYSKDYTGSEKPCLKVTYTVLNHPPNAPTSLLCEGQTNPTEITDTTPEFSAICTDNDNGDTLTHCAIQVDDDPGFGSPIWDSGKTAIPDFIEGNRCSDVSYAGGSLTPGTTYYWRVKFWDDNGAEGAWSTETATFRLYLRVEDAWVYWRFDNSTIDGDHKDGWGAMSCPDAPATLGIWSYNIEGEYLRPHTGETIYWRVKARASDGRENWSPVYTGGKIVRPYVAPNPPTDLKVEGQTSPQELTTLTPEFSFKYTHDTGDDMQAFQIQVGTSPGGNDMWDNTQDYNAENGAIVTVTYAGDPLSGGATYWWRVKVQDNKNCWSDWSAGGSLIDSYSESNKDVEYRIEILHPADPEISGRSAVGQAFSGTDSEVRGVKFYLKRSGSPGNLTARLYEGTGTLGTDMVPTGSALASSAEYDASTISTSSELVEFLFTAPYQMSSGTDYCVVIEASSGTWNFSNSVLAGADWSSPSHEGNYCHYYSVGPDSWHSKSDVDTCFYLYGPGVPFRIALWAGEATFELENMYKVSLEKDLWLSTGSKLVVKFYKYGGTFQAESVIDEFTPPYYIEEDEDVPHPLGTPVPPSKYPTGTVQVAKLVLTTDNTEEVISEIASFTVTRTDLMNRYMEILIDWPGHPEQHAAFRAEITDILTQWASAPP